MKTAFAQRVREVTARVTIGSRVFGPEEIESIKVVRGLSNAEEFVIGSSFSKMLNLTLIDKHGTLNQLEYTGALADVEIGVKVEGVYQYQPLGRYVLEKPIWERKTRLSMTGFDELQKAAEPYPNTLEYPATLAQVFQNACAVAGLPYETTAFPNSAVQIIQRPLMYDITCREVMEHVAGLAGGYCVFESGKVRIVNIAADNINVSSSNIKSMQRDEERGTKINKLVMQQTGAEDYIVGTGSNPYYLTDNIFIQGDPERWAPAIFEQINGINFFPAEITFNGNPTGAVNKYVDVEYLGNIYQVLPGVRTLTYHGGLKEEWVSKPLSNTPLLPSGEKLVQSIRKNQTKLTVIEGEISSKVSESTFSGAVGELNQRVQTAEEKITPEAITQTVEETTQELAKRSEINQLADAIELKASKADVDAAIDRINRANPNLVSNKNDNWDQGDIVSGNPSNSTTEIRTVAFYPIRAGKVHVNINPLYQVKVILYDQFYNYATEYAFTSSGSFDIASDQYFKAVVRRSNGGAIVPDNIENTELKIEVGDENTIWTPYYGDLTLDQQKEFFTLVIESSNGLAVDRPNWSTTLTARLFMYNDDVTIDYDEYMFTWYYQRAGEDPVLVGGGRTLNVTSADIPKTTTYILEFQLSGDSFTLATLNNDDILTLDNNLIMATGIDTGFTRIFRTDRAIVRDVGDRVTAAEATLSIQANQIQQKVEQSSYNADKNVIENNITTLTTKVGSVEAKIDGATHTFTQTGYEFRDTKGDVIFSLTKGMANEQNLMKCDDCENGYPLIIPIHIGASTASIEQVLIKWRNSPFRATAKSAASGGGTKTSASGGGTTSGASSASTTASGGSASVTSASGGGHTSGGGGGFVVTASDILKNVRYQTGLLTGSTSGHTHSYMRLFTHGHDVALPSHTHQVYNHSHTVSVPAHSHSMPHTHSNPNHTHTIDLNHSHNLVFGVVEQAVSSNALTIWVDGVQRGSVNAAQGELDVTPYLQTTGWHIVQLRTTTLKRIDANIFVKSYIRR